MATTERIARVTCTHDCPDACAMLVTVRDGRAVDVSPNPAHPVTGRHLCVKGDRYLERVYHPDRLLTPLNGGWTPDVIEEFFAPSYRRYLNPTTPPLTREGQRDRASRLRTAFPDATATLEDLLAEGDRVAYRLTIRGTHRGVFQGIPPTGKHVTVSLTAIVRIENGKVVEEWGGLDLFDLRQRIQIVADPGTA